MLLIPNVELIVIEIFLLVIVKVLLLIKTDLCELSNA